MADINPSADFSVNATNIILGQLVSFTFTGSEGNPAATYLWDFGDSKTSTDQKPIHRYSIAGTYTVNLTVTDFNGDSASNLKYIIVNNPDYSNDSEDDKENNDSASVSNLLVPLLGIGSIIGIGAIISGIFISKRNNNRIYGELSNSNSNNNSNSNQFEFPEIDFDEDFD